MGTRRRSAGCLLILLTGLGWAGETAAQEFATTAGIDFAYCQARRGSCSESSFETSCRAGCNDPCEGVSSSVNQHFDQWIVSGQVTWAFPPFGDLIVTVSSIWA